MASSGPDADWSGAKSMILSRRFWGLWLIIFGRLWITWTGSTTLLNAAADPIVAELLAGLLKHCCSIAWIVALFFFTFGGGIFPRPRKSTFASSFTPPNFFGNNLVKLLRQSGLVKASVLVGFEELRDDRSGVCLVLFGCHPQASLDPVRVVWD